MGIIELWLLVTSGFSAKILAHMLFSSLAFMVDTQLSFKSMPKSESYSSYLYLSQNLYILQEI